MEESEVEGQSPATFEEMIRPIQGQRETQQSIPAAPGGGPFKAYPGRRRLVEECEVVRVEAIQQAFGKKALLTAICQCLPLSTADFRGLFRRMAR